MCNCHVVVYTSYTLVQDAYIPYLYSYLIHIHIHPACSDVARLTQVIGQLKQENADLKRHLKHAEGAVKAATSTGGVSQITTPVG